MATASNQLVKSYDNFDLFKTLERDETAKVFAQVISSIMWDENDKQPDVGIEYREFAHNVHEAIIYLGSFMRKIHLKILNYYFKRNKICIKNVFKLLKNYCRAMQENCENIFFVWLHSLALTDTVLSYLKDRNLKGNEKVQTFAPVWWEYIFNKLIKNKFHAEGSWKELKNYISTEFYPRDLEDYVKIWDAPLDKLNFDYCELEVSDAENYPSSDDDDIQEDIDEKRNESKNTASHLMNTASSAEYIVNNALPHNQFGTDCNKSSGIQMSTEYLKSTASAIMIEEIFQCRDINLAATTKISGYQSEQRSSGDRQRLTSLQTSCVPPKKRSRGNESTTDSSESIDISETSAKKHRSLSNRVMPDKGKENKK